jgi:hypothetical protein
MNSFRHDEIVGTQRVREGVYPLVRASLVSLLAVLTLNGCTAARTSISSAEASGGAPSSSSATSPPLPTDGAPSGPIRFVLADTYAVGDTARVRIDNVGDRPYRYRLSVSRRDQYAACPLHYFDPEGREFIIPPGTHCDIVAYGTIKPGETKLLFRWKLDECVRDDWGCVRSKLLAPGTYTISGRFKSASTGNSARAESSFELLPSS